MQRDRSQSKNEMFINDSKYSNTKQNISHSIATPKSKFDDENGGNLLAYEPSSKMRKNHLPKAIIGDIND